MSTWTDTASDATIGSLLGKQVRKISVRGPELGSVIHLDKERGLCKVSERVRARESILSSSSDFAGNRRSWSDPNDIAWIGPDFWTSIRRFVLIAERKRRTT